ncbi:hypothetical protein Golax_004147 [Gossypium laxum]|uniref:Uncharacterized protein n=1 Tax=Gossypium laxum TaxID=34288 RepID=A0A7J9AHQ9_9ROSI|nr:hypothetical protein [Gossypium laxum]
MKTRKNQLDLLLEVVQHQAKEHISVEECVEPNNSKLEKEVPYISVEHDLKADFQQEIEIGELGEELGIIEEISNPINICLEELPHLLDIMDEIPQHEMTKEVLQQRYIQIEMENSKEIEFVVSKLMIPRKVQWSGLGFGEKRLIMYMSKWSKMRGD